MSTNETVINKLSFFIDEPPINVDTETCFANYTAIPASALRNHLITVRQRAWQLEIS